MTPRSRFPILLALLGLVGVAIVIVAIATTGTKHASHATLRNGAPAPAQHEPGTCTVNGRPVTATNGQMGACAPKPAATLRAVPPTALRAPRGGAAFIDLSNNDPVYGVGAFRAIRSHGFSGVVVKLNQAGYVDPTAARMLHDARAAGLRVGGYGFRDPGAASANRDAGILIGRARALGVCGGRGVIPLTADLEYGNITASDAQATVSMIEWACGGAEVYTGAWYANPHFGCRWPRSRSGAAIAGWISAYGVSDVHRYLPCGLGSGLRSWQWTDAALNGAGSSDASVYLGSLGGWDRFTNAKPPVPPVAAKWTVACSKLDAIQWWKSRHRHVSRAQHHAAVVIRRNLKRARIGCSRQPHSKPYRYPQRRGALA